MSEAINSGVRRTRKVHRCEYCADIIPAASQATWWSYSDGGRAGTAYAHPECDEMFQEMRHQQGWEYDEMPYWDEFRDACSDGFSDRAPFPWDEPL